MIDHPRCPVCDGDRWIALGQRTYSRAEMDSLNSHARDRFRVVFEVWTHDTEHLTVKSMVCGVCGFILFSPRPSAEDISNKYRFLQSIGSNRPLTAYDSPRERQRSRRLHKIIGRHLPDVSGSWILDFGGADGRLMQELIRRGARCDLIDYCETPIPGVVRLGSTESSLPIDAAYDAIICSHVLEHLADPFLVVKSLAERLRPGGILYAEVPMEIWGRPPLPKEPVTHVNFFTPTSMNHLVDRVGLGAISCGISAYPHPDGPVALVIGCLATKGGARRSPRAGAGLAETRRYLKPGLLLTAQRAALMPSAAFQAAARKFRRSGSQLSSRGNPT